MFRHKRVQTFDFSCDEKNGLFIETSDAVGCISCGNDAETRRRMRKVHAQNPLERVLDKIGILWFTNKKWDKNKTCRYQK